ncbi:MAG: hypothetical protein QOK34_2025 [Gaiellaceae bacterium]|jgi:hypothetical protein|nr:hypothetical protein [Gaiellaceae bacterium]
MKVRLSLSALVAVVAALSLTLSAGAANRPGDFKRPVTHWWYSAKILGPTRADMVIRPHAMRETMVRPLASAGWTRAAS